MVNGHVYRKVDRLKDSVAHPVQVLVYADHLVAWPSLLLQVSHFARPRKREMTDT